MKFLLTIISPIMIFSAVNSDTLWADVKTQAYSQTKNESSTYTDDPTATNYAHRLVSTGFDGITNILTPIEVFCIDSTLNAPCE